MPVRVATVGHIQRTHTYTHTHPHANQSILSPEILTVSLRFSLGKVVQNSCVPQATARVFPPGFPFLYIEQSRRNVRLYHLKEKEATS